MAHGHLRTSTWSSTFESLADLFGSDCSPAVVHARLKSLQPSALQRILKIFESPPPNISALQVLRTLWRCAALRPSILQFFSSMDFETGGCDERLIDEVEVLLAAHARDGSTCAKLRVQTISMCATAVCSQSKCQESRHAGPLLVYCARAVGQIRTERGRAIENRILKYLLSKLENGTLRLGLIVAILDSDMDMNVPDESVFLCALDSFVALHCEDRELPAIFRATVASLGRARTNCQVNVLGLIALNVMRKATTGTLSNVLDVLGTVIMDSEIVCQRLVDAVSHMIRLPRAEGDLHCEQAKVGPSHISLLYFLLASTSSRSIREGINMVIEQIISDAEVVCDTSKVASSSTSSTEPTFSRTFALLNSTQIPAVCANGETIARVFEGQVWSQRVASRTWGIRMLFEVFALIPRSRGKVVSAICTALTNGETPDAVLRAFCGLLERLCDTRKSALHLRDFSLDLQNLLNFVDCIPVCVDCRVVSALARLSIINIGLTDQMFVFLRKAAGSRLLKLQRVACAGLLAMMEHNAVSEETRLEACKTFGDIFELSEEPLSKHLNLMLIAYVDRNVGHSGHIRSVSELLARRLTRISESHTGRRVNLPVHVDVECAEDGANKDSWSCFEGLGSDFFVLDDVPLLLKLCNRLMTHHESIARFVSKLIQYLGNVKQVLRDAYEVCNTQIPIPTRIAQLCSLYETIACIDISRFSSAHVRAYAICLLTLEYETSKSRCGTSSYGLLAVPQADNDVAMFASVSAREAVSVELTDLRNACIAKTTSLKDCIDALHAISSGSAQCLWRRVVQRELMRLVLIRLRSCGQVNVNGSPEAKEFEQLLKLVKQCFVSTCPWRVIKYCDCCEGKGTNVFTTEDVIATDGAPELPARQSCSAQNALQCAECERMASEFLSAIGFPGSDLDNDLASTQISKLSRSLPSSLRHISLTILVELLSNVGVDNEWTVLHSFMREAWSPGKDIASCADLVDAQETEGSVPLRGGNQNMISQAEDVIFGECHSHTEAVSAAARVFRLEFEHSLSTALTMSYINLFSYLLKAVEQKQGDGCRAKEVTVRTITGLLRDYSIRHSTVLKGMVTLLLNSLDRKSGLEFSTSLINWLGNDVSLQISTSTARMEEATGPLGVDDFDADIIEEAILSDSHRDQDSLPSMPPKKRVSNHAPVQVETLHVENASAFHGMELSGHSNTELVKALCLNEGEESAILSITCVLAYFGQFVRSLLEVHRHSTKRGFLDGGADILSLLGVVNAMRELFRTPFIRLAVPHPSTRIMFPVWKRLGDLIQDLLEIVEVQLRLIMMDLRKSQELKESSYRLLPVSKEIFEFLCGDEKTSFVIISPQFADHRSRMIFLQEKLDTTATAFLLCTDPRSGDEFKDLRSLLQRRIREIGTVTSAKARHDGKSDFAQVRTGFPSRPKKRPHIRSRNRYVDGWLREEKGDDSFVDLEDFIVPMDES